MANFGVIRGNMHELLSQVWYRFAPHVRPDRLIPWSSYDQRAMAPDGSLSDSSRSSPEKGRRFHEHMVENLVRFIAWLAGG